MIEVCPGHPVLSQRGRDIDHDEILLSFHKQEPALSNSGKKGECPVQHSLVNVSIDCKILSMVVGCCENSVDIEDIP